MKKRTAVLFVVAGMMLNACNPLETSKPIETTAAIVETTAAAETMNDAEIVVFETESVEADSDASKGSIPGKRGDTNPLRPVQEDITLKPQKVEKKKFEADDSEVYNPGLGIAAISLTDPPEDLYHYESTSFYFDGEEWFLDIYTSAMPDGEYYAYDDQNRFFIRARYGEYQFNLFDDWVQLGFPEIDMVDDGKRLHIVMTDIRTASYTVTDFSFLSEDFYFEENTLIDVQGGNYMGSLNVK